MIVSWGRVWIACNAYKGKQRFAKEDNHQKCVQSYCRQRMVWMCQRYCLLQLHLHNWLYCGQMHCLTHVGSSASKTSIDWTFFAIRTLLDSGGGGFCLGGWQLKVSSFFGTGLPWFQMWQLGRICLATDSNVPTRFPCQYMAHFVGSFEWHLS